LAFWFIISTTLFSFCGIWVWLACLKLGWIGIFPKISCFQTRGVAISAFWVTLFFLSAKTAEMSDFIVSRSEIIQMKVGNSNSRVQKSIENFIFRPKTAIFRRVEMREGGLPLPLAFQYLTFVIWRACDLNLVMISLLASKWQDFKLRGLQFHFIKQLKNGHSNFKNLLFWSQSRYHEQI
jgi:hypothetical protein